VANPLDGTISIGGKAFEKKYVALGLVGTAGVAYFVVQKRKASAAANQLATDQAAGDQVADDSIDPQTGYPYGSAEDDQALSDWQNQPGLPDNTFTGGGGGVSDGGGFTSNAAWAQAAESAMGSTGTDSIAAALGHYLTGQQVTADEVTHINEAIAIEGYPPIPGTNGYPPAYKTAGGTSTGSGGGTPNPSRKKKTVVAPGGKTLREIASEDSNVTSYAQARALNPWAHRFTVKSKPIPKGYKVTLYAA
jgi:hypothetical protein